MLKLMYITNDPQVAQIAADAGVDRIFIDMEVLGKVRRQGHLDSVKSHHVPEDIRRVRERIGSRAEILARVNPRNPGTQAEVDAAVKCGADLLMLPMWRCAEDVAYFAGCVGGRDRGAPVRAKGLSGPSEVNNCCLASIVAPGRLSIHKQGA